MPNKILISVDSTCDIGERLTKEYGLKIMPLHITQNGVTYEDGVNITPQQIYANFDKTGELPKTSAVNTAEYRAFFESAVNDGYSVIHLATTPAISSSCQNSILASEGLDNVHVVDSKTFTIGTSLLVTEVKKRVDAGMDIEQILDEIKTIHKRTHVSFVVDNLDYLCAGGRCSTAAKLGANLLGLKPCIEVDSETGAMFVGKKYRGKYEAALKNYIDEKLAHFDNICPDFLFFAEGGVGDEMNASIKKYIEDKHIFKTVEHSPASCTISSHCGAHTLGIAFLTEE